MREMKNKTNTVGRPREFDEDEALSQIMNLFWENGYQGTSLSEIMDATQLKKGSLYAAFGGKHDMYIKALAHYEVLAVDSGCAMLRGGGEPRDKLGNLMSAPVEAVFGKGVKDRRGCFLCNASADRAALDADTDALVRRGYDKLERALSDVVAEIYPNWDKLKVTRRARLLLTTYSGLRIMARSADRREPLDDAKFAVLDF